MKKIGILALLIVFAFQTSLFAEREVLIKNPKTGEATSMDSKGPEAVFEGEGWLLLDDFEDGNLKNYLKGDSGAWNLNPMDEENANADIEVVEIEGPDGKLTQALKLTYDVDSEVQAQNGYWTKLRGLDGSVYDTLEFDVKCDEELGCSSIFKIELKKYKNKERTELIRGTHLVEGVSDEWSHIELKLNKFTGIMDFGDPAVWQNPSLGRKDLEEFVIVFKDRLADQKSGALLIDNIKFTQQNNPGPTAVDGPPRAGFKTPPTHFKLLGDQSVYAGDKGFVDTATLKKGDGIMLFRDGAVGREVVYEEKEITAEESAYKIQVDGTGNFVAGSVIWKSGSQIAGDREVELIDGSVKKIEDLVIGDALNGFDTVNQKGATNTVTSTEFVSQVGGYKEIGVRLEGIEFQKYLAARLKGYPAKTIVKKEFPEDDREFLMEIARDTWKFFANIVDKETHLPLDTVQFAKEAPIYERDAWVGDYTNITNIGMYFLAIVGAYELKFITKEEAVELARNTIESVKKLPKYDNGFLFNYYDTTTMEQTSYFISSVDSGWLSAGLITVRNAFPELYDAATEIIDSQDYSFFYDPVDQQLSHGFYQHLGIYSDYNYGAFYTEPRATSYIGVGTGDIPVDIWFKTERTFPEEYYWQQQEPINRVKKEALGVKYFGGFYKWKDYTYVPSWGGSLFEALMPTLVIDEKGLAPDSLGKNGEVHARMHAEYAKEVLGYPVWGMSPSSVPEGGYSEYGVKVLGSKGYKPGVVTPHVTGLAVNFIPEEAIANFRKLIELYDIYGEYGFYDAVTVETSLVAYKYLALDQGMLFGGLANYLTDGKVIQHFMNDEIAQNAVELLTSENLFDPPYDSSKEKRVMRRKV